MKLRILTLASVVLLAWLIVLPAHGQVRLEDLAFQNKPLEPGAGVEMAEATQTGSATLGDGIIIFKFRVTDIDPIADDNSDVAITCILIQNLGTATGGSELDPDADIVQVMLLDQDTNAVPAVANPAEPAATGETDPDDGCASMAATTSGGDGFGSGSHAQIPWEVFFDLTEDNGGFIIPDDGSELFQVAVRTNDTIDLADDSQNHTLILRATLQIRERVGSPPFETVFVDPVTDLAPEVVWNGGINRFTEDTWVVNPIMPGDTGVVSRFTVCDWDSNNNQLILRRFYVRQDEVGTALSTDIVSLDLYRVEGFTRTLVASRTPDATFERGGGGPEELAIPGSAPTAITIPDDTCMTFELEAQVSQFAFKGHVISPRISISADEPSSFTINADAEP
ncbi:MAG TPA: hypothetical protein VIL47_01695, partial [Candidatus Bipolaricaulota bacterium]